MPLLALWNRWIDYTQREDIPFGYFVATFFSVVVTRMFLEFFSDRGFPRFPPHFHYLLFYLTSFMVVAIIVSLFVREKPSSVLRFMLANSFVILVPPLADLLVTGGKGMNMAYLLPGIHGNLLHRFFTLGGSAKPMGITLGIKLEVVIILLGLGWYVYYKTSSLVRALAASVSVYVLLFFLAIFPFFMKFLVELLGGTYRYSTALMLDGYLMFLPLVLMILLHLQAPGIFASSCREFSFLRLLHYYLMIALGMVIAHRPFHLLFEPPTNFFSLIILLWGVLMAAVAVTVMNNISDVELDRISNPHRMLVRGVISRGHYAVIGGCAIFLSVVYTWAVHYTLMFFLMIIVGLYAIYSLEPLRLKRLFLLSKAVIAANSIMAIIIGYTFMGGPLVRMPFSMFALFFIGMTLAGNVVDIKDYEGDKAHGIITLPVLLGVEKAKALTALFFLINNFLFLYAFDLVKYWYLALAVSGAEAFLLLRRRYSEKSIFLVFESSSLVLILLYLLEAGRL